MNAYLAAVLLACRLVPKIEPVRSADAGFRRAVDGDAAGHDRAARLVTIVFGHQFCDDLYHVRSS